MRRPSRLAGLFAAAIALGAGFVLPAAAASAAGWAIVPSPNASAAPNILDGVTCLSPSDCWAVGRSDSAGVGHTLIEHWDGSSWSVVGSPDIPETRTNFLSDVACAGTNDCWAVGYVITNSIRVRTLILRWDGSSWTVVPSPDDNPASWNALYGVECTSGSNCWAVGSNASGSVTKTLTEHWDGASWAVVASPNPNPANPNLLYDVSCAGASDCWAVGSSRVDASTIATLTVHWNGSSWTAVASPNPLAVPENILSSVTCTSALDCWAVGTSYNGVAAHQTLIQRWNGTAWTMVTSPNAVATVDNYLSGVTCTSATNCWAAGHANNGAADQPLILVWNGTVWLQSSTPSVPTEDGSALAGVDCTSSSDCWAVGSMGSTGSYQALPEHWNGTSWSTATAPSIHARQSNFLDGITCLSTDDCWAVGFWFSGNVARTLTVHWDGSLWSIVPSPNINANENHYLGAVSCVSASDCWAVGSRTETNGLDGRTLILHWDGNAWTIVPSAPDTSAAQAINLTAVACASATECLAVGHTSDATGHYQAISMTWDGTTWSLVPVPLVPEAEMFYTPSDFFYAVMCSAPSDCWAAGNHWSGLNYRTLVEHWDGSSWTASPSPNTVVDRDNTLSGVTCASSSDCWAVGRTDTDDDQVLILHWNGTAWSIVPAPRANDFLTDVTCASASECWAVGRDYGTPGPKPQTMVVRWDGSSWKKVASPNTPAATGGSLTNNLAGVACAAASDCWAVGQYWPGGFTQSLTLHYTPNLPPIALLTADPLVTGTGVSVSFGGGASSDPNAGDTIASWVFDFGDGTPPVTRVTPDVSHVYAATGTFTASLTVTDNHGLASTNAAQLTITVTPNLPPTARLTASVTSGTAPLTVGFDASASSDPDSGDTLTYTMTFGDGTSPTTNTTPAFRHTYEEPGGYTASLIVTDSSGQESDNTAAIIINVLPDSVAGAPAITDVDVTSCDGTSSLTLIVTGVNLAPASVIQVNGADRATTYVSSSRMRISIFASDLGLNRTVTLRVVNPDRRTSETTTATIVRPADVTLDGSVDAQDLVIVANYLVGNVTPGTAPFAAPLSLADVNHDTAVDVVDIVVLANHLVGNISCLSTD